ARRGARGLQGRLRALHPPYHPPRREGRPGGRARRLPRGLDALSHPPGPPRGRGPQRPGNPRARGADRSQPPSPADRRHRRHRLDRHRSGRPARTPRAGPLRHRTPCAGPARPARAPGPPPTGQPRGRHRVAAARRSGGRRGRDGDARRRARLRPVGRARSGARAFAARAGRATGFAAGHLGKMTHMPHADRPAQSLRPRRALPARGLRARAWTLAGLAAALVFSPLACSPLALARPAPDDLQWASDAAGNEAIKSWHNTAVEGMNLTLRQFSEDEAVRKLVADELRAAGEVLQHNADAARQFWADLRKIGSRDELRTLIERKGLRAHAANLVQDYADGL